MGKKTKEPKPRKCVLEYNPERGYWTVWASPTLSDRLLFLRHGNELMGIGKTREQAIERAREYQKLPPRTQETIEL